MNQHSNMIQCNFDTIVNVDIDHNKSCPLHVKFLEYSEPTIMHGFAP